MNKQFPSPDAAPADEETSPPNAAQLKTKLDVPPQGNSISGPGDSPPLPADRLNSLNDGIDDQRSRRAHRKPVAWLTTCVVVCFTLCLAGIIWTLGSAYSTALNPDNIAKITSIELREQIRHTALTHTSEQKHTVTGSKAEGTQKKSQPGNSTRHAEEVSASASVKEAEPLRIEAKIYGEIRDSMVPLVALVSILAVAIVVLVGTMLRAAFAPHPNYTPPVEKEEVSPVPIIEALKSLAESIKAVFKP